MEDWKKAIAVAVYVQQAVMDADKEKLWPYYLPEVAATSEQIQAVEKGLGFELDAKYKEFLRFANGWRAFYQSVDLFGTEDLLGSPKCQKANALLGVIEETVLRGSGFLRNELFPIGATDVDIDVFAMAKPDSKSPGVVVWFAGTEIERFQDFDEYFLSMVDYNRNEIALLKGDS